MSDRASAIGTFAEIISGMKGAITPSTEPLYKLFLEALHDPDAEVHSNAAFAMGLLVENTEIDLSGQYLVILSALRPHFDITSEAPSAKLNARDNAAGAVARLILRNTAAVPLEQVLPILLGALPLKNDYLENRPVFRAIFHLFRGYGGVVLPFVDQLLPVFLYVLEPSSSGSASTAAASSSSSSGSGSSSGDQLGDEVRAELLGLVNVLNSEIPEKIQAAGLGPFVRGV